MPEGGTEVRMLFAGERDGKRLFHRARQAGPDEQGGRWLSGDAVVSLSPVSLWRRARAALARALAAKRGSRSTASPTCTS